MRPVANCYTPFTLLYFLLYEIGDVIGARARHVTCDDVTIRGVAEPRLSESGRARRRRLFGVRAGRCARAAGRVFSPPPPPAIMASVESSAADADAAGDTVGGGSFLTAALSQFGERRTGRRRGLSVHAPLRGTRDCSDRHSDHLHSPS